MTNILNKELLKGSKWSSNFERFFEIIDIKDNWVFYKNIETNQEYHCLIDAFLYKFTRILNEK